MAPQPSSDVVWRELGEPHSAETRNQVGADDVFIARVGPGPQLTLLALQPAMQVVSYGFLLRHGPQTTFQPLDRLAKLALYLSFRLSVERFPAAATVLPTELKTGHPPSVRPLRYAAFTATATRCHRIVLSSIAHRDA